MDNIYNKNNYIDEDAKKKSESAPKIKKKSISNYNTIKTNNKNKKNFQQIIKIIIIIIKLKIKKRKITN